GGTRSKPRRQAMTRPFKLLLALTPLALWAANAGAAFAQDEPAGLHTVRGRVVEVRPAEHQITVQPRKGGPVKLTVDDRSQIQIGQGVTKLDQLREGMRVRANYNTKNGANHVLTLRDPLFTLEGA